MLKGGVQLTALVSAHKPSYGYLGLCDLDFLVGVQGTAQTGDNH